MKLFSNSASAPTAAAFGLLATALLCPAELEIKITGYGTFENERVLTWTEVEVGQPVAIETLSFFNSAGDPEPFYFVPDPGPGYSGRLYLMWDDTAPPFEGVDYFLRMSEGTWSGGPFGDDEIAEKVESSSLLLPNLFFDEAEEDQPSEWTLTDNATFDESEAYRGRGSIKLTSEFDAEENQRQGGSIRSQRIPFVDDERYRALAQMKITEQADTGSNHRGIMIQMVYFNADGNRLDRSFYFYPRANTSESEYLNQWVPLRVLGTPPEGTRYGEVAISTMGGFEGVCHIDAVVLEKFPKGEPLRFEVGDLRKVEASD